MASKDPNKSQKPELVCMVEATGTKFYTRSNDAAGNAKLVELTASSDVIHPDRKRPCLDVEPEPGDGEGNATFFNHISEAIVDKINNNSFVDLETLLEEKHMAWESFKTLQLNDKGELVTTEEKSTNKIDCWYKWVKAYGIFTAL